MSNVSAVLDACVLYRGLLTDVMLNLADAGLFEPIWSLLIRDEWKRNLASRLPQQAIDSRATAMDAAYPKALVPLDARLLLEVEAKCSAPRYVKDAHVTATAVTAQVSFIVTTNISDFPKKVLDDYGLMKIRPDTFCLHLLDGDEPRFLDGIRSHRLSLKRTRPTPAEYLAEIAGPKAELVATAKRLEAHVAAI